MHAQPDPQKPCPACGEARTWRLVRWSNVPVHQNLLFRDAESARGARRGDLDLRGCVRCQFVFNAAFDPDLLEYGEDYDNRQSCSAMFSQHMNDLIEPLLDRVRGRRVLEVGCGKGHFLRELVQRAGGGTTGIGFDPTYVGPDRIGDVSFRRTFYEGGLPEPAEVVLCRHVIEHVPEPTRFLASLRATLPEGARLFLETPCVAWILRNRVTWDLFYEHCSLFTLGSLAAALRQADFVVHRGHHVFEGQYLWMEAGVGGDSTWMPEAEAVRPQAIAFARQVDSSVTDWQNLLSTLRQRGSVILWGAGAKGVTFCNLADPRGEWIDAVVDINPAKQDRYIAGTGHRIHSPDALPKGPDCTVLVLNPNYFDEIERDLSRRRFEGTILDLMKPMSRVGKNRRATA